MSTVKVEYIGVKPVKADNVAGTATIWQGHGDVQEVSEAAWAKLSKHPDIWRLAGDKPKAAKPEKKAEPTEPPADDKPPAETLGVSDDEKPAQEASGLTPEQWVALSAEDREDFVAAFNREQALAAMTREQLHALAKERGVKVHPNAGAETVRAKLAEAGV
jgi:hypothetical protein